MKKCRPVVKEPSGGTLLFRCALPARGASSAVPRHALQGSFASALPARGASLRADHCGREVRSLPRRCLHGVHPQRISAVYGEALLCLGAACTGCIDLRDHFFIRCDLCLGAACTGCIPPMEQIRLAVGMPLPRRCLHGVHHNKGALFQRALSLPRRCLHGVHHIQLHHAGAVRSFASALPARGASLVAPSVSSGQLLCLGAACTGCIPTLGK